MRSSSEKDLAIYDFDPADETVEVVPEKFKPKFQSRSKPSNEGAITKYDFLQAFTSGLNVKRTDVTDIPYIDLHDSSSPPGSFAVDTPEKNFTSMEEKSELDNIIASSTSSDVRGHVCLDELDSETPVRIDPLVEGASGLVVPSVGKQQVSELQSDVLISELQSDGTPVDVLSDDEASWSSPTCGSLSTSVSDFTENGEYMEQPVSDDCYTAFEETDTNDTVIISTDFLVYRKFLYEEAQLVFFSDSILVKCSDASRNEALQWAISDIIHIECQWSGSAEAALVKLNLKASTEEGKVYDNCDIVELIFSVTDMQWLEKEHKIKSLAERYGDIWNALHGENFASENDVVDHSIFFPKRYFTEIPDCFEDVIYPKGDPDAVSISKRDIELLQPNTFINDTIIDFYIKYLKGKIQPNEKHRFHFFNSFFFRKLADLDKDPGSASEGRAAFQRVRKWTRKVNIFEKDYIFIPVNFNLHWSLLVICHPGEVATSKEDGLNDGPKVPCILHMDSIKGSHIGLKNLIQSYLWEEWKERHPESQEDNSSKFSNLRFVPLEVPQQENSFDCGLFLLHYVELFLEEAPVNFSPFMITKFSNFLSVDWFSPAEASFKRSLIRKLIYELLNDPSQSVVPTLCSDGHPSSEYCGNSVEQEPAVEFLSEHCSPSKTDFVDSACLVADRGTEINFLSTSSLGIGQYDKLEELVPQEFHGPEATSVSFPEHRVEEDEAFQMSKCATCPKEGHVVTGKQLVSFIAVKDDCRQATQTCSTSHCPKEVGEFEMPWSSLQEKEEIGEDLLPKSLKSNLAAYSQSDKIRKPGSPSIQDCNYVPDSPTTSSGENEDCCANDSQEIDTCKAEEGGKCENSQGIIHPTEVKCGGDEKCQKITAIQAKSGDDEGCEETNSNDSNGGKAEETEDTDTSKAEAEVAEVCQVDKTDNPVEDGDCGECQEVESGGSCQESLPPSSSQDVLIIDDENSSDRDSIQLKRDDPETRLEQQPSKRRKVLHPEGRRRRTRSSARDLY